MRKIIASLLAAPLLLLSLLAAPASASSVKASFEYHVGDALIQSLGIPAGDKAIAPNGDVVTVIGTGTFDSVAGTATGGGTFVHHEAATGQDITGTFVTTGLISFQSYGPGTPQGLPASFFGGKAMLSIVATPDANPAVHLPATLTVTCALGTPPPSAVEGVQVNVHDVINFNKAVPESGATVFVLQ
jgi:hypothetical protein